MRGAPMKAVQELLGHSTILMTMRYPEVASSIWRDLSWLGRVWAATPKSA